MAYLAVNFNGEETVSPFKPDRDKYEPRWSCLLGYSFNSLLYETTIILPEGTIEKIIGRQLTWADEPVKIE